MPLNYTKLKLAFFIALRFLSFRINRSFITFISYISIIGITIGILALIVVMSVMNGFHVELKNKILNVISDVQVINYNKININNKIINELENDIRVSGVTTFSDSQGMMLSNKIAEGVVIKGIDRSVLEKYDVQVWMTMGTFSMLSGLEKSRINFIDGYAKFKISNLVCSPIVVPHDAKEPSQFAFEYNKFKFVYLTDLGHITDYIISQSLNANVIFLEFNYDN